MNKIIINTQSCSAVWYHDDDIMHISDITSINVIQTEPHKVYGIGSAISTYIPDDDRQQLYIKTPDMELKIYSDIEIETNNEIVSYSHYVNSRGLQINTAKRSIEL